MYTRYTVKTSNFNRYLTDQQRRVLDSIRDYMDRNDMAPTLTELMKMVGIGTKRGVVVHLDALEKKGYINRTSQTRGIVVLEKVSRTVLSTPVLGYANAGKPMAIADEQQLGILRIDKKLLPITKEIFALIIKGDSMNNRDVNGVYMTDSNYAIISKDAEIRNGDVVLAIIDNCATIKTFKKMKDMIALYPESSNPVHQPIFLSSISDAVISGKVISVLENPKGKWGLNLATN